jgi:SAM-dependent methyltransferase
MTTPDPSVLRCPVCRDATLAFDRGTLRCQTCGHRSPGLGRLACLLADPEGWRGRWSTDLGAFVSMMASAAERVRRDLARFDLLPSARSRLEGFLAANERNATQIEALFANAGVSASTKREEVAERTRAAAGRLPLTHHYELLLRDWAWGEACPENVEAREHVLEQAGSTGWGRTLVLGAGAGRLTYDLHQCSDATLTLALDLDPLLSLIAHRVLGGQAQPLVEFPFAPDADAHTEHVLRRPDGDLRPGLQWLVADALDPPVHDGAWDTVLTAWFIDVCDQDVRDVVALVHRLLAPGGRWINVGPLLYPPSRPPAERYVPPEVVELVRLGSFDVSRSDLREVRYLRSPQSGHARLESVLSFVAEKVPWAETPGLHPPAWVVLRHRPIPKMDAVPTGHPLLDRVAALVDGERSLDDIVHEMAGTLPADVGPRDATAALLLELHRRVAGR